jgi:hypothetical protein
MAKQLFKLVEVGTNEELVNAELPSVRLESLLGGLIPYGMKGANK